MTPKTLSPSPKHCTVSLYMYCVVFYMSKTYHAYLEKYIMDENDVLTI